MCTSVSFRIVALLIAAGAAPAIQAEQGLLTFVFGPSSQEAARQSARAAAAAARHWQQTEGGIVQIRRAGSADAQTLAAGMGAKEMEQAFTDAAVAAREVDPPSFLITLDSAAQAAALSAGARIVVAVLNSPPFSSEGEHALEHLAEVCQGKSVRVLVLDIDESSKSVPNAALNNLATRSGGAWVRQARALEPNVATAATMAAGPEDATPAAPAAKPTTTAAAATPPVPGAIPKFEIPVHIRFMRTSGSGSVGSSMLDHDADFGTMAVLVGTGGAMTLASGSNEVSFEANDSNAPLQGMITVESPLNALKFETDDNTNTYQARARITATVLNVKGTAIWSGRRDVNVHGPVQKMAERQQGSMFFMRSVNLAGKGPFTLEAKVEDLIAGTSGVIQTPLKTSRNVPGLVATDAVVVRPFKGSADKFEADQVLSYEGEALSPVLDPVFRSEQPINLQIYLRLYPDIHGAPLDLSMEIVHDGRVVARMPLPFKSGLANNAREGGSGFGGAGESMLGGQAKEFPYLADMKGAKFSPGDYRAIISIRQGKGVIKRAVAFQVVGKAQVQTVQVAGLAKAPAGPNEETENVAVALPEIEPAAIDASGLKMRADEQKRLWDDASKTAMGYLEHLPDFRCFQETHRFTAPLKNPDQLKEADSFKDALMYEGGKVQYQRIEINGVKPENTDAISKGILARNEFGSLLRGLFDPETAAVYKWAGRAMAMGVLCEVFEVDVKREKSNFMLNYGGMRERVGYSGRVFIDEETNMVRRLTISGVGLPKEFGLQSPALSLDYGMVRIGKADYLLPLRSVLQLRHAKAFVRNESVFRGYRKFEAESEIKFNN
ncbi:MAG: hypothetical protein ABSC93_28315 [Bryobacteraceae bacterium]|jgi:hypothetical protein